MLTFTPIYANLHVNSHLESFPPHYIELASVEYHSKIYLTFFNLNIIMLNWGIIQFIILEEMVG